MNKKKLIAIGGSILLLIGLVTVILTNRSTTSAPNILGAGTVPVLKPKR